MRGNLFLVVSGCKGLRFYLMLLFFALNLQFIVLYPGSGFAVKPYHLIALCFFPVFLCYQYVFKIPVSVMFYVFIVLLVFLFNMSSFGINADIVNFIFCLYLFLVGNSVAQRIKFRNTISVLSNVSLLMLCVVFINMFLQRGLIISFLQNPYGHPTIQSVYGGGVNLDATWIAMLCVFVLAAKYRYIYTVLAFILSALLASRVGFILNVVALKYKKSLTSVSSLALISMMLFLVVVGGVFFWGDYILQRFQTSGSDYSSFARFDMWIMAKDVVLGNPFGVGLGNAISSIKEFHGIDTHEGNLHNIFIQSLVEQGVIGFVLFVLIFIDIFRFEYKTGFNNPLGYFILMYYMAGLIQFRSVEVIFWFVLGCYFATRYEYKASHNIDTKAGVRL